MNRHLRFKRCVYCVQVLYSAKSPGVDPSRTRYTVSNDSIWGTLGGRGGAAGRGLLGGEWNDDNFPENVKYNTEDHTES